MSGAGALGRRGTVQAPSRVGLLAAALVLGALAGCGGGPGGKTAEPDGVGAAPAEPGPGQAVEAAVSPAPSEPRQIPIQATYGETAEHTLAGGECHVLELELEADRYVEMEVEQLGVDLYTTVEPPGGGETVRFDAPVGGSRPEPGAFVSKEAGTYRLAVCPWAGAAAPSPYRLRIERPRVPTERARALADGFRSYGRGAQRASAGEIPEAHEHFSRALESFREADAPHQEGWSLYKLGTVAERSNDLEAAEAWYRESAGLHAELGDVRQEALVLIRLGRNLHRQGRRNEALEVHRRSLGRAEDAGDGGLTLEALTNTAYTSEELGYALQAIELQQRRKALAGTTGDPRTGWDALTRIAKIYLYSGRRKEAFPVFEEALGLARDHGLEAELAKSLHDLGRAHIEADEPDLAARHLEEALEIVRGRRDRESVAEVLNNLGRSYRRLGERQKALEALREALSLTRELGGEGVVLEALVQLNVATVYLQEGNFEAPVTPCRRAYEILRDYDRPGFIPGALRCLARIHRHRGELEQASEYAREAVAIVETYRNRSAVEDDRSRFLANKYGSYELLVDVLLRLEERDPGKGHAEAAFQIAEQSKGRTLLDSLAQTEAGIRQRARPELAAREAELQKQMSSLERSLLQEQLRGGSAETAAVLEERLQSLQEEHARVVGQILADSPGWSALLASEPATLEEIRAGLLADGDSQLVSFLLGEERSYVWIVGPDSLAVEVLPARQGIEVAGRQVAQLLAAGEQPHLRLQSELVTERLSEELLEPLMSYLTARKLLLVKDGALHYVPFAALPLPGDGEDVERSLVLDRFELVEVPSATAALALSRRHAARPAPRREVAILADPVFEADDERLDAGESPAATQAQTTEIPPVKPTGASRRTGLGELERLAGSAQETHRISALVRPDDLLVATGVGANRHLLLHGGLGEFRIVHLAGHGLSHSDLTGLVLSMYDERGRSVDGLVQPYELYGLSLSADLVVLSACRTGLGQEIRGEGLMGLSRGFLHAGASQVLASLWDVDDAATAELMSRFYTAYLVAGEAPAQALRTAQRSLQRSEAWAAPHYWAGFVLQGAGA